MEGRMAFEVGMYKVVLAQPNTMACWATVYTMMTSWKRQASFDIASAVGRVGARYLKIYQANTGLPSAEFGGFLRAAGMSSQPMMNVSIPGWEQLLMLHGLLWVGTLAHPAPASGLHSRIIEGISGDGSPGGTSFKIIDPAGGRRYVEPFGTFIAKYEGAIRKTTGEYYQIRHFV
jgi:Papain-like cysteine protease AvrRpt2